LSWRLRLLRLQKSWNYNEAAERRPVSGGDNRLSTVLLPCNTPRAVIEPQVLITNKWTYDLTSVQSLHHNFIIPGRKHCLLLYCPAVPLEISSSLRCLSPINVITCNICLNRMDVWLKREYVRIHRKWKQNSSFELSTGSIQDSTALVQSSHHNFIIPGRKEGLTINWWDMWMPTGCYHIVANQNWQVTDFNIKPE
jgi:hypothetical protein